ncbi:SdpI/YhfL family protein [Nocardiopsis sp. Huas11]|uniref:SdpI family protein n=1 Tax=Nocardiopsis sp. Huas11 TaxID=2183912 RepID=UPI000EADB26C|nr:SdpI family protein [Nocardiopsis sp. Huas11]RKS07606.1 SdpI/YhfL family protein [Nocardiopsis sp. Huas11]
MADWFTVGICFGLLSAFLGWTSFYSVRDDVNISRSPGIRIPTTLASRESWLTAHRRAQPYFFGACLLMSVAGAAFVVWAAVASAPGSVVAPMFAVLAVMTVALVFGAVLGVRDVRRSAGAREANGRH